MTVHSAICEELCNLVTPNLEKDEDGIYSGIIGEFPGFKLMLKLISCDLLNSPHGFQSYLSGLAISLAAHNEHKKDGVDASGTNEIDIKCLKYAIATKYIEYDLHTLDINKIRNKAWSIVETYFRCISKSKTMSHLVFKLHNLGFDTSNKSYFIYNDIASMCGKLIEYSNKPGALYNSGITTKTARINLYFDESDDNEMPHLEVDISVNGKRSTVIDADHLFDICYGAFGTCKRPPALPDMIMRLA